MGAPSQKALLIMDNFTGQTRRARYHHCDGSSITTDRLKPLDVSTNKAAKYFLQEKIHQWYAKQVQKQLDAGVEATAVAVNMGMLTMKKAGTQWLTALYDKLHQEKTIGISKS